MPMYDYQCKTCEHIFGRRLSISDRKLPETEPCPECGEMNVLQYISGSLQPAGQEVQENVKQNPEFRQLLDNIQTRNHLNVDRYRR